MPNTTSILGFVAAALVVLLIPGPGVLYVVARSLAQGQRAGLASVLGLASGALVHVPGGASLPVQILVLGLLYVGLAIVTDGAYALLAARLRGLLGSRALRGPAPRYASGGVYIGLGVATALSDHR